MDNRLLELRRQAAAGDKHALRQYAIMQCRKNGHEYVLIDRPEEGRYYVESVKVCKKCGTCEANIDEGLPLEYYDDLPEYITVQVGKKQKRHSIDRISASARGRVSHTHCGKTLADHFQCSMGDYINKPPTCQACARTTYTPRPMPQLKDMLIHAFWASEKYDPKNKVAKPPSRTTYCYGNEENPSNYYYLIKLQQEIAACPCLEDVCNVRNLDGHSVEISFNRMLSQFDKAALDDVVRTHNPHGSVETLGSYL